MPFFGQINDTDTAIVDGTIQNKELQNCTISYGGVSLALGGACLTPSFNLTNAFNYDASSLSGSFLPVGITSSSLQKLGTLTSLNVAGNVAVGAGISLLSNGSAKFPGSVGIGTDNPTEKLDVHGNIKLTYSDQSNGIRNKISFVTEVPFQDEVAYIAANRTALNGAPSDLIFVTGSVTTSVDEKLRITSDGNVGIGSTQPTAKLDVAGIVSATSFSGDGSQLTGIDATQIQTDNTSVQTVDTGSDGHVKIITEGTERLRVISDGNVGIGSTIPTAKLDVAGSATFGSGNIIISSGGSILADSGGDPVGDAKVTINSNGNADFTGTVSDSAGGLRTIPQNAQATSYSLAASDVGKHISISSGNITVIQNIFSIGDIITIYNNSTSSILIQQSGTTLRKAGTVNTGNCSLAEYGTASILCVASNVFVVSGNIV